MVIDLKKTTADSQFLIDSWENALSLIKNAKFPLKLEGEIVEILSDLNRLKSLINQQEPQDLEPLSKVYRLRLFYDNRREILVDNPVPTLTWTVLEKDLSIISIFQRALTLNERYGGDIPIDEIPIEGDGQFAIFEYEALKYITGESSDSEEFSLRMRLHDLVKEEALAKYSEASLSRMDTNNEKLNKLVSEGLYPIGVLTEEEYLQLLKRDKLHPHAVNYVEEFFDLDKLRARAMEGDCLYSSKPVNARIYRELLFDQLPVAEQQQVLKKERSSAQILFNFLTVNFYSKDGKRLSPDILFDIQSIRENVKGFAKNYNFLESNKGLDSFTHWKVPTEFGELGFPQALQLLNWNPEELCYKDSVEIPTCLPDSFYKILADRINRSNVEILGEFRRHQSRNALIFFNRLFENGLKQKRLILERNLCQTDGSLNLGIVKALNFLGDLADRNEKLFENSIVVCEGFKTSLKACDFIEERINLADRTKTNMSAFNFAALSNCWSGSQNKDSGFQKFLLRIGLKTKIPMSNFSAII